MHMYMYIWYAHVHVVCQCAFTCSYRRLDQAAGPCTSDTEDSLLGEGSEALDGLQSELSFDVAVIQ